MLFMQLTSNIFSYIYFKESKICEKKMLRKLRKIFVTFKEKATGIKCCKNLTIKSNRKSQTAGGKENLIEPVKQYVKK